VEEFVCNQENSSREVDKQECHWNQFPEGELIIIDEVHGFEKDDPVKEKRKVQNRTECGVVLELYNLLTGWIYPVALENLI
jgi:hypothetical protein